MAKPVYIFSGLLDAGKSSDIKRSITDPDFHTGEKILIISFEQGDVQLDNDLLNKNNSSIVYFDNLSDFTKEKAKQLDEQYKPAMIMFELNGLTDDKTFDEIGLPDNWIIVQRLCFIDASTFKLYMNNMGQFIYNHVKASDTIVCNRCDDIDIKSLRNNLKAINMQADIFFEDSNGPLNSNFQDNYFDLSLDVVNVSDMDYGLWYMDMMNNPNKYEGATISINAFYIKEYQEYDNLGDFGRKAMVCCANDVTNIGLSVVDIDKKKLTLNHYYNITGTLKCIKNPRGNISCVMYLKDFKEIEANNDLVSFN